MISKMYRWNIAFFLLLSANLTIILAAIEGLKCQKNHVIDTDQAFFMQDFGPDGVRGPINVTIANSLQPGAVVSVVTKSETRGSVNLIADDIYVIHVDARILKAELIINTSKRLNLDWDSGEVSLPNPVEKGAKTTTTLIFEAEGYRVFINGKEIAFYEHRTERSPRVICLYQDYVYKVMYMTTRNAGVIHTRVPPSQ